jgi:hypothetical protein
MTEKNSLLLTPSEKIEETNVFRRKISMEFLSRTDLLDSGSVLSSNSATFYADGLLFNSRGGDGVYSGIPDSYSLGTQATFFNRKFT